MSCLLLFMHEMPCALVLALARAGNNMPAKMAIMAITTSNSIRVKPPRLPWWGVYCFFILIDKKINGRYWMAGWARTIDGCVPVSYSPFYTTQKS